LLLLLLVVVFLLLAWDQNAVLQAYCLLLLHLLQAYWQHAQSGILAYF
jgi:hypothetical protein